MKEFEIRDPIYGFISFNDWEKQIIDHPVFQRLRRIRQLGLTDMVYPGAMHTRFEHSLGVMYLITRMYDFIISNESNKRLLKNYYSYNDEDLKRDRQIVRLAGLLHDVGHAPFSHASEELMPKNPKTNKPFKHEDYTGAIIEGPLKEVIENHPLNTHSKIRAEDIANLIEGNPKSGRRVFWKILISSQLDTDRCDYLLRDSLHIGVKYGVYDLDRLLITLTLGKDPETENIVLGIRKGGWHVAESLIISRHQMFTQVYYHKTRRAYDYMLKEALREVLKDGKYPNSDIKGIKEFLKLDDYVVWSLMEKSDNGWFQRIKRRDHLRMVAETKESSIDKEIELIENCKHKLGKYHIWYWEDNSGEAKSWYKMGENEEILIINDKRKACPLSMYSKIVESLIKTFSQIRVYVKSEDRNKALGIKEVIENEK